MYRPDQYWSRLLERDEISRTGHPGLPTEFNAWLYRNGRRNLDSFLARQGVTCPERVFDAGSGTGYWAQYWVERGAKRVEGCDLVPAAVARLSARLPGTFIVHDLTKGRAASSSYPLVSAMNVLLHVTEDEAFTRALEGLAAMVEPGGLLLLAEPAVEDPACATPYDPAAHARIRHISAYAPRGLECVAIGPTAVIGADPIEGCRCWKWSWRLATGVARRGPFLSRLAGTIVYAIDPGLLRCGFAPSGKFLLFRRPGDPKSWLPKTS